VFGVGDSIIFTTVSFWEIVCVQIRCIWVILW